MTNNDNSERQDNLYHCRVYSTTMIWGSYEPEYWRESWLTLSVWAKSRGQARMKLTQYYWLDFASDKVHINIDRGATREEQS